METIRIPKGKVLELLKKDACSFADYDSYRNYEIELTDSYTRIEGYVIYVTFEGLSSLLYDRVVSTEGLTVIVV